MMACPMCGLPVTLNNDVRVVLGAAIAIMRGEPSAVVDRGIPAQHAEPVTDELDIIQCWGTPSLTQYLEGGSLAEGIAYMPALVGPIRSAFQAMRACEPVSATAS